MYHCMHVLLNVKERPFLDNSSHSRASISTGIQLYPLLFPVAPACASYSPPPSKLSPSLPPALLRGSATQPAYKEAAHKAETLASPSSCCGPIVQVRYGSPSKGPLQALGGARSVSGGVRETLPSYSLRHSTINWGLAKNFPVFQVWGTKKRFLMEQNHNPQNSMGLSERKTSLSVRSQEERDGNGNLKPAPAPVGGFSQGCGVTARASHQ